tara:strand:+ start:995 stop:1498 length:504 start_codon:yes stop_codon:yes gene_type:complete
MGKINLKSNNRLFSTITFIVILSLIVFPILSYVILYIFPHFSLRKYLFHNIFYIIFIIPIALYVLIARLNYYTLKIDSYVIDIKVYRTGFFSIFGFNYPKDFIDISHEMLENFSFFNRPYSFNKTLMIKIKKENGIFKKKRFNLSFLTKKEQSKISETLKKIIAKNS